MYTYHSNLVVPHTVGKRATRIPLECCIFLLFMVSVESWKICLIIDQFKVYIIHVPLFQYFVNETYSCVWDNVGN